MTNEFKPVAVALFGTCGESRWREPFVDYCEKSGLDFFNPQLKPGQWKPDAAQHYVQAELHYFEKAPLVVFAITDETLSSISLMEVGFSLYHLLVNKAAHKKQELFVFVDDSCNAANTGTQALNESIKTRKMLKKKLKDVCLRHPQVKLFDSVQALLDATQQALRIQP